MTWWQFLGSCRPGKTQQEIQMAAVGHWHPWSEMWLPSNEAAIVVPDPEDPDHWIHAQIYLSHARPLNRRFAAYNAMDTWYFWAPANERDQGAITVLAPKHEGYWRSSLKEHSQLPWPQPNPNWDMRLEFLVTFDTIESRARRIPYRGTSICRLCGRANGHEEIRLAEWTWPSGFRHYVADHHVRPTPEFETFILGNARRTADT